MNVSLFRDYLPTPLGMLRILACDQGIRQVGFVDAPHPRPAGNSFTALAKAQLAEYFSQQRRSFDVPLVQHGTAFQLSVWAELIKIPFGTTCSYGDIASALGNPRAMRAIGAANSRNPIAIIVPCHRVIGANGTLTGYAGGLDKKASLLTLESDPRPIACEKRV